MKIGKARIFLPDRRYYYLALEGMTELMYFERLRDLINASALHPYRIELVTAVEHSPRRAYKRLKSKADVSEQGSAVFWHIRDMENPSERQAFYSALRELKQCGMRLCYSNYTFELWLLLHKCRFAESLADKRSYLKHINKYYNTNYSTIHEYKEHNNMRRMLMSLTRNDVLTAIENADSLMAEKSRAVLPRQFCGFTYYEENPAVTVQDIVRIMYFGLDE